jgi:hypothetical protein
VDSDGGLLLDDVEHVRVSDCLIRDDRPGKASPAALRLTRGRENVIADNLLGGRVEIAEGTAEVR